MVDITYDSASDDEMLQKEYHTVSEQNLSVSKPSGLSDDHITIDITSEEENQILFGESDLELDIQSDEEDVLLLDDSPKPMPHRLIEITDEWVGPNNKNSPLKKALAEKVALYVPEIFSSTMCVKTVSLLSDGESSPVEIQSDTHLSHKLTSETSAGQELSDFAKALGKLKTICANFPDVETPLEDSLTERIIEDAKSLVAAKPTIVSSSIEPKHSLPSCSNARITRSVEEKNIFSVDIDLSAFSKDFAPTQTTAAVQQLKNYDNSTDESPEQENFKPYQFPKYVGDDAEEKFDYEDPAWDSLRTLTTAEERCLAVWKRWNNTTGVHPNVDLTYTVQSLGRSNNNITSNSNGVKIVERSDSSLPTPKPGIEGGHKRSHTMAGLMENRVLPPLKRMRTLSCTRLMDLEISKAKKMNQHGEKMKKKIEQLKYAQKELQTFHDFYASGIAANNKYTPDKSFDADSNTVQLTPSEINAYFYTEELAELYTKMYD